MPNTCVRWVRQPNMFRQGCVQHYTPKSSANFASSRGCGVCVAPLPYKLPDISDIPCGCPPPDAGEIRRNYVVSVVAPNKDILTPEEACFPGEYELSNVDFGEATGSPPSIVCGAASGGVSPIGEWLGFPPQPADWTGPCGTGKYSQALASGYFVDWIPTSRFVLSQSTYQVPYQSGGKWYRDYMVLTAWFHEVIDGQTGFSSHRKLVTWNVPVPIPACRTEEKFSVGLPTPVKPLPHPPWFDYEYWGRFVVTLSGK